MGRICGIEPETENKTIKVYIFYKAKLRGSFKQTIPYSAYEPSTL